MGKAHAEPPVSLKSAGRNPANPENREELKRYFNGSEMCKVRGNRVGQAAALSNDDGTASTTVFLWLTIRIRRDAGIACGNRQGQPSVPSVIFKKFHQANPIAEQTKSSSVGNVKLGGAI